MSHLTPDEIALMDEEVKRVAGMRRVRSYTLMVVVSTLLVASGLLLVSLVLQRSQAPWQGPPWVKSLLDSSSVLWPALVLVLFGSLLLGIVVEWRAKRAWRKVTDARASSPGGYPLVVGEMLGELTVQQVDESAVVLSRSGGVARMKAQRVGVLAVCFAILIGFTSIALHSGVWVFGSTGSGKLQLIVFMVPVLAVIGIVFALQHKVCRVVASREHGVLAIEGVRWAVARTVEVVDLRGVVLRSAPQGIVFMRGGGETLLLIVVLPTEKKPDETKRVALLHDERSFALALAIRRVLGVSVVPSRELALVLGANMTANMQRTDARTGDFQA
jgi:hypothetical protein